MPAEIHSPRPVVLSPTDVEKPVEDGREISPRTKLSTTSTSKTEPQLDVPVMEVAQQTIDIPQFQSTNLLDNVGRLVIDKKLNLIKLIALQGRKHSYNIYKNNNEKVMTVEEKSDQTLSYFLGNLRPLKLLVKNTDGFVIFYIVRPFAFTVSFLPAFFQEMFVYLPPAPGQVIGKIQQLRSTIKPLYSVISSRNEQIYLVTGPRITCQIVNTFTPLTFNITRPNGEEVGSLIKPTLGIIKSTFVGPIAYQFQLNFPENSSFEEKALLLATGLLIDYMHYG